MSGNGCYTLSEATSIIRSALPLRRLLSLLQIPPVKISTLSILRSLYLGITPLPMSPVPLPIQLRKYWRCRVAKFYVVSRFEWQAQCRATCMAEFTTVVSAFLDLPCIAQEVRKRECNSEGTPC